MQVGQSRWPEGTSERGGVKHSWGYPESQLSHSRISWSVLSPSPHTTHSTSPKEAAVSPWEEAAEAAGAAAAGEGGMAVESGIVEAPPP